jgi:hypothetical protein
MLLLLSHQPLAVVVASEAATSSAQRTETAPFAARLPLSAMPRLLTRPSLALTQFHPNSTDWLRFALKISHLVVEARLTST